MLFHPHFPKYEDLRRLIWETLMASHARCFSAQRFVSSPDHLSIGCADCPEFVEGEDDTGVWQNLSRDGEQVDAQREEMVEMDYVRTQELEELDKGFDQERV